MSVHMKPVERARKVWAFQGQREEQLFGSFRECLMGTVVESPSEGVCSVSVVSAWENSATSKSSTLSTETSSSSSDEEQGRLKHKGPKLE